MRPYVVAKSLMRVMVEKSHLFDRDVSTPMT
jgi:hypothetical protein